MFRPLSGYGLENQLHLMTIQECHNPDFQFASRLEPQFPLQNMAEAKQHRRSWNKEPGNAERLLDHNNP